MQTSFVRSFCSCLLLVALLVGAGVRVRVRARVLGVHACVSCTRVGIWQTAHDTGSVRCRGERVRPSAEILQTAPHVGVSEGNWRPVVRWADASIHPSLLASCIHPKCFSTELTQCRALWLAHLLLDTIRVSSKGCYCPG